MCVVCDSFKEFMQAHVAPPPDEGVRMDVEQVVEYSHHVFGGGFRAGMAQRAKELAEPPEN